MRLHRWIAPLILLSFVAIASARPWQGRGAGGWGPAGAWNRLWNPRTVEVLTGQVVRIQVVASPRTTEGVHLVLATGAGRIPVALGPAWYLEHQDLVLAIGDRITVKGSRVVVDGKPMLVAAEVTRGDDVLVLRSADGFPRWAAWRRGNAMRW